MDYAVEAFKITAEQKNKLAAGMKSEPRAKSGVKFPAVARLAMARQKEDKRRARLFSQSVRDRLGDMGYSFRNSAGAPPEQLQNIAKLVEERMPPSIKEVFEREPIFAGERTAIYGKAAGWPGDKSGLRGAHREWVDYSRQHGINRLLPRWLLQSGGAFQGRGFHSRPGPKPRAAYTACRCRSSEGIYA